MVTQEAMPITAILQEQAKVIEHLAGIRDGFWNQLYNLFPLTVEQLSNQIFTH